MQKGKSAIQHPPHNEADADAAEEEREIFAKLQTRLRLLEKDREVQRWQAQYQIQRQEQEMEKLMAERERLQKELGMRDRAFGHNRDQERMEKLQELMQHNTSLDQELETEEHRQQDLKDQISDLQRMLLDLRKEGADPRDGQSSRRKSIRAQRILEDKLQKAVIQFNQQISRNGELREELEIMFRVRARWQRLIKSRKKESQELQEEIQKASKECLAVCNACVQSYQWTAAIREECKQERLVYDAEIQRLQLLSSYETGQMRFFWSKRKGRESSQGHSHTQVIKAKEAEDNLDCLKQVFDQIRSVTGEEDIDKLLHGFVQAEDRNFSLFKFVNKQNKEIKALKDTIEQIQGEIEEFQVRRQQRKQSHRAKMEELSKQLQEVEAKTALYEDQASVKSSILEQIKTRLNSICSKINCDSDDNFSSYLGALEQRTNEMLTLKAWVPKERRQEK